MVPTGSADICSHDPSASLTKPEAEAEVEAAGASGPAPEAGSDRLAPEVEINPPEPAAGNKSPVPETGTALLAGTPEVVGSGISDKELCTGRAETGGSVRPLPGKALLPPAAAEVAQPTPLVPAVTCSTATACDGNESEGEGAPTPAGVGGLGEGDGSGALSKCPPSA
jgi:hypothetical protein